MALPYLILGWALLAALYIVRLSLGRLPDDGGLEIGYATTAGNRELNCDDANWTYFGNELCVALADGVGTGPKAQTAARAAAQSVTRIFQVAGSGQYPAYFMRSGFNGANKLVLRYIPDGTTGASLLCALIREGTLYYALAGNCRISVFRGGSLIPLSEGHTIDVLARHAFKRRKFSRAETLEAIKSHRLYNYVGKYGFKDLEMFDVPVKLKRGDIIVLMTSGVYESCETGYLERMLQQGRDCENIAWQIINPLKDSSDPQQGNATIVLVRVKEV